MGLFDSERQSHNTVYALHRFMLGIYCMTVSRSCKGKRVWPNPWHNRLRQINNLRKRRLSTIMLRSRSDLQSRYFLCISYFQLLPVPSPGYCGAFARLVNPGGGAFANIVLPGGRAFANPGAIPELLIRTRFPIKI